MFIKCMYNYIYYFIDAQVITSSPGIIKKVVGGNAIFTWDLADAFDVNYGFARFNIYKGYESQILLFQGRSGGGLCNTFSDTSLTCITNGNQIGFIIAGVDDDRASRYSISVDLDLLVNPPDEKNSNAILYIYSKNNIIIFLRISCNVNVKL